jgi:hypothetical protein
MELRNLLAMAVIGASATLVGCGSDDNDSAPADLTFVTCNEETMVCTLEGTMTEDYTLTTDYEYRLSGLLQVGEGNVDLDDAAAVAAAKEAGATLTIAPGVHVEANSDGVLLVTRGSKLMAEGTAADPITFSSRQDDDFDGLGEWGGVVVQGFAPQYGAGNTGVCGADVCNVAGEGGDFIGNFGGIDKADNSGVIKYVRIAEAGKVAGPNNEINGLTLQGVGHGTTVEYVQVHGNQDDGIEWFGGTVNVKYAVLTNNDDDAIDFDEGYQGNIQYAIVLQNQDESATPSGSNDPRGIEANSSDDDYVTATAATLANITVINGPISAGEPGVRFRGSVNLDFVNSVVASNAANAGCVRIDDSDHDANDATDKIDTPVNVVNVIASGCDTTFNKEAAESEAGLVEEVAVFDAAVALTNTAASLVSAPTITATDNGSSFAFDQTDYIGAVEPGTAAADAWYAGWIIEGSLDDAANYDAAYDVAP